jgi:O-antigen/teichoic acid export membrane protein
MLTVFFATMHQRVCNLISDAAYGKVKLLIKRLYLPFSAFFIIAITLIGIFANIILSFFTADVSEQIIFIFRISLLIPCITLFNIMPYLLLLAHNLKKEYSSVTIPSAIFLIISLLVLVPKFQVNGAILALGINELFIVFYLFYKLFNSSIIKYYTNGTQ